MIVDASVSITTIRLTATRNAGGIRVIYRVSSKEPAWSWVIARRYEGDLLDIGEAGSVDSWEGVEGCDELSRGRGIPSSTSSNCTCEVVLSKTTGALAISSKAGDRHDGGCGW